MPTNKNCPASPYANERNQLANPNAQTKSSKLISEFCFQADTGGRVSFLVYIEF